MNQEDFQDYVVAKLKELDKFMNGNGHPGVKVRLDRLEQTKLAATIVGTILLVPLITAIFYLVQHIAK